jgi:2-oxo-4-hydroxy-4-carboxy--5-ureidoimidazoline (OHCU) decarboxylase
MLQFPLPPLGGLQAVAPRRFSVPWMAHRCLTSRVNVNPPPPNVQQLGRLRELILRTSATNRNSEKQAIIREYPDLRELLEL